MKYADLTLGIWLIAFGIGFDIYFYGIPLILAILGVSSGILRLMKK